MDELTLTSSLSMEEINENFKNIDFFLLHHGWVAGGSFV